GARVGSGEPLGFGDVQGLRHHGPPAAHDRPRRAGRRAGLLSGVGRAQRRRARRGQRAVPRRGRARLAPQGLQDGGGQVRLLLLASALLLAALPAAALGAAEKGTAGAAFLTLEPGARAEALGGAFGGVADDALA